MGRPCLDEGARELIEYPYIIVYEVFEARDKSSCGQLSTAHKIANASE
jgi:hypothetical protein